MKNIFKISMLVLIFTLVACKEDYQNFMGNAKEGGVTVDIAVNDAKVLGSPNNPNDLPNSSVTITDVALNFDVLKRFAGTGITKYEVVKSFNGGTEVVVGSSATLPLNVTYTTIAEFLDGTGVSNPDDLRIGDSFLFKVKVYNGNNVYYLRNKTVDVVVSCSSNLAGAYYIDYSSGRYNINVTEVSAGLYESDYLPPFSNYYWFQFKDVCGTLYITDWQYQGGNPISPLNAPVGYVDTNGDLVFQGITVDGVSWYVNRDFTINKL